MRVSGVFEYNCFMAPYAVALGAVEPSRWLIDPTLIDALAVEAEQGRRDP